MNFESWTEGSFYTEIAQQEHWRQSNQRDKKQKQKQKTKNQF